VLVLGVAGESPRVVHTTLGTPATVTTIPLPAWATQTAMPYGWMQLVGSEKVEPYDTGTGFSALAVGGQNPSLTVGNAVTTPATAIYLFQEAKLYDGTSVATGLALQREVVIASAVDDDQNNIWAYTQKLDLLVTPTAPTSVNVSNATNTTPITVTTSASHGLTTGDYVRVASVLGNAAANGHWLVTVTSGTTLELDGSVGSGAYTSGGTVSELEWITVYDADTVNDTLSVTELANSAGTVEASMGAVLTNAFDGRAGWSGIRLTSNGEGNALGFVFALYTVATSGQMDGQALFTVSYYSSASRVESVSREATRGNGKTLQAFGGRPGASEYRWDPQAFRTSYLIEFPGSDDLTGTPNYALIYRSDPFLDQAGTTLFSEFFYSGSKSLPTSEPLGGNDKYVITTADDDVTRTAPTVGTLPIPSGSIFATANDRFFVAGTSSPSELWVSRDQSPFRFRHLPHLFGRVGHGYDPNEGRDLRSGFGASLDGPRTLSVGWLRLPGDRAVFEPWGERNEAAAVRDPLRRLGLVPRHGETDPQNASGIGFGSDVAQQSRRPLGYRNAD
jgi:hypothetical protein